MLWCVSACVLPPHSLWQPIMCHVKYPGETKGLGTQCQLWYVRNSLFIVYSIICFMVSCANWTNTVFSGWQVGNFQPLWTCLHVSQFLMILNQSVVNHKRGAEEKDVSDLNVENDQFTRHSSAIWYKDNAFANVCFMHAWQATHSEDQP